MRKPTAYDQEKEVPNVPITFRLFLQIHLLHEQSHNIYCISLDLSRSVHLCSPIWVLNARGCEPLKRTRRAFVDQNNLIHGSCLCPNHRNQTTYRTFLRRKSFACGDQFIISLNRNVAHGHESRDKQET